MGARTVFARRAAASKSLIASPGRCCLAQTWSWEPATTRPALAATASGATGTTSAWLTLARATPADRRSEGTRQAYALYEMQAASGNQAAS